MASGALHERADELAIFDRAIAATRDGQGGLVLVEAPAGAGKTRLLAEAVRAADAAGLTVLRATGGELEATFPFGVVRQLLERRVRALDPGQRGALLAGAAALAAPALGIDGVAPEGPDTQLDPALAARHGLFWLIANLAEECPLALVVDDGHWADDPSLAAIDHLARRLDGLPVLVVVAARPEPDSPVVAAALDRLATSPATTIVRPGPLSVAGVTDLATELAGGPVDDPTAEAISRATGGNPFLVEQLLLALAAEGRATDPRAVETILELGPRTIGRSIVLRLGRRSDPALALASATALLGLDATLADAAHVAGLAMPDAAPAADELRAAGILDPGPHTLVFTHPIVRTAIVAELASGDRTRLHARAAELLSARGAAPERVALHLLQTPPGGSDETVSSLWSAALAAQRSSSPGAAARFLRRALAEPPAEDRRAEILAELGVAEHQTGDSAAGAEHLSQAVALCEDLELRVAWMQRLARAIAFTKGPGAGFRLLDDEADRIRPHDAELAMQMEALGLQGALMDPGTRDIARGRLAGKGDDIAGDTPGERRLLALMALDQMYSGVDAARATDLARRSCGDGRLIEEATAESPFSSASYAWTLTDLESDALQRELDGAVAQARALAAVGAFASACGARALLHLRRGRLVDAVADAENTLDALEPIDPGFVRLWCQAFAIRSLVDALVLRGELDEAEAVLARHDFDGELMDWVPVTRILPPRAALRLAQGRVGDALADLAVAATRSTRERIDNPAVSWRITAVEAHLRDGDPAAARAVADEHLERARAWDSPGVLGQALHLRALCEEDAGAREAGLTAAIAVLRTGALPLAHLAALVDLGATFRVAGERRRAVELLQDVADRARALGATALADRALDELASCGLRPRRLAFSGVDALTPSERRIADMAAAGSTNREIAQMLFVTPKTVENHLGRVYGKLDVRKRSELAAALGPGQPST